MTCFTVRSNIHPTSAPTATDDDIEGNNKADALCWGVAKNRNLGSQRNCLLKPETVRNVAGIYDISRSGMHLWVVGKSLGVAELRYCAARLPRGKVTRRGGLHSVPSAISLTGGQNCRSFLGIYEFIRTACDADLIAKRPRPGMSHER